MPPKISARIRRLRLWPVGLLMAGLIACAAQPLPQPEPGLLPQAPTDGASAPQPSPPRSVEAPPQPAAGAASEPVAPYGAAVAARFPDPKVSYRTPAFEPGHAGFTSNTELQALLRSLP